MRRSLISALAVSASALVFAAPAFAQEAPAGTDIVITGSRAVARSATDSPVPVDVISGDTLQGSGYTETNKVLNQLVPSFNFPQPSLTDGTDSLRPATLRGLAPDQVLVLVNGKRRHTAALINLNGSVGRGSSAVDLNELPPIAIDRIEVLRDGASSQYGSDAIAGVINVQLSRKPGVRGSVTYGKYLTTMDGVYDYSGVALDGSGNPVILTPGGGSNDILKLNYTDERERHDGDTLTIATNIGLPVGDDGYLSFSAQFRDRDPTNRSGADPRRQYSTVGNPAELTFDRFSHGYGDGKTQDMNFVLNAGYDFGDVELYAFGTYGIRDGVGAGFYRRSNDSRNRDWSASTTTFVPYQPDGYLPVIASQIEDVSGALGARGKLGGFDADLSVVYGSNQLDYSTENSFNVSLGGLDSPRKFDAGGIAFGQTVVNLDLSRPLDVSFFKKLGVAFGVEYRNENFKIRAGDEASYINGPYTAYGAAGGAQVFPGFRPSNAIDISRDSFAAYLELDADVIDALSVQVAGRYEHYSDFGDTWNGKAAARLELIKGIAVRGSISTGFRAPSLAQQYFATTSTNNVAGVGLIEVGTFPATSAVAAALGGKPLKPEKAVNIGGGIVLTPFNGLTFTADYYNIKINDRVTLTENLTGSGVVALLQGAGINNVTSARFFINGVDTRTQGVDLVGTYKFPDFGAGKFTLTLGYNYNETKITDRAVLPNVLNLALFGRSESYRLTDGQPRTKFNAALDWSMGIFGASIRTNRYGTVKLASSSGATVNSTTGAVTLAPFGSQTADYELTPKWVTDVEVHVQILKSMDLAVGADNVFDVYPDLTPLATGSSSYFLPYSSSSPFGFNGRFVYSRVSFNF